MKKLYSFVLLLCAVFYVKAQTNHVPNGSFESYTQCPTTPSQTAYSVGWKQYGTGTSDYLNVCGSSNVGVPNNMFGHQQAAHGQAYAGGACYSNGTGYREYIARAITPLQAGVAYEASMSVSLCDKSIYASNNLGMYFYDNGPSSVSYNTPLPVTPQVLYTNYSPITDTQNWVRLKRVFLADSAYDNVVIGGYLQDNAVTLTQINSSGNYINYYYFDSIVVKLFTGIFIVSVDTDFCAGDTVSLSYYAAGNFTGTNVFTLQLSDAAGSFTSPVNIGTLNSDTSGVIMGVIPASQSIGAGYRMRVVASSQADTSENNGFDIAIGNIDSANVLVSVNDTLCTYDTLLFSASTNVASTTYSWTGSGGFNTTKSDTSIVNPVVGNSGTYYATIKFYGCEVRDTIDVLVKPAPAAPVLTHNTPVCEHDTLKLSASSSTSGVTFGWSGPNGFTATGSTVSVANAIDNMTGNYTATVTKNGCSSSGTVYAQVKTSPDTFYLSVNLPLCEGDTMQVQSTGAGTGVSYSWTGPGSYTAGTQNVTRIGAALNMSGWYKLVAALNNCTYEDSIQVTVNQIPAAPTTTFSDPLCVGETLSLTAASLSGATYKWNGPNSFNSSQQNPVRTNVTLADTGTYTVTATNNTCESPAASLKVSVNPQPFVVIFSNKDSLCAGEQVIFTALPNNTGGTPTYQWYVNAQAVGTGTTYTSTGINHNDIIRVDMTEYTKCSQSFTDPSNDIQMTVLPWLVPTVTITSDKTGPIKPYHYITFTATAVNAGNNPEYQWKRNGTDVLGAKSSQWSANTLSDNDSINVEVKSSYRCPEPQDTFSNGIVVKVLTSVGEIEGLSGLTLYPNPNNGVFTLEGEVTTKNQLYDITIINAIGQIVYRTRISVTNGKLHHVVNTGGIAQGVYILKLSANNGSYSVIPFRVD